MRHTAWVILAAVVLSLLPRLVHAQEPLVLLGHRVDVDYPFKEVRFVLTFDRPPDFFTTDAVGRQADFFHYSLWTVDTRIFNQADMPHLGKVFVTGAEIAVSGSVRLRQVVPGGPPGPIIGEFPFTLAGTQVRFRIPFDVLNTDTTNTVSLSRMSNGWQAFAYFLMTGRYGRSEQPYAPGMSQPAPWHEVDIAFLPHLHRPGQLAFAVFTTPQPDGGAEFRATDLIVSSVRFGRGQVPALPGVRYTDVDGDGATDLVLWFDHRQAGDVCGRTPYLVGRTRQGVSVLGDGAIIQRPSCPPPPPGAIWTPGKIEE